MSYKHGNYGEILDSQTSDAQSVETAAACIGTAPVNLVRGYADLDIVNMPVKVSNMTEARKYFGYSDDWDSFTLCEAMAEHFDNTVHNVGPVYFVNVLDPDTHRSSTQTSETLTVSKRKAEIESSDIILDTFVIADMAEDVDYSLTYDFNRGVLTVKLLDTTSTASELSCTYYTVDASMVEYTDIIGAETDAGAYTGLYSLKLMMQYCGVVLNLLAAPGWSQIPAVYKAMVEIVQKLNGHWDGFINADIPLEDSDGNAISTLAAAEEWKEENEYTSEYSKVYWPKVKDASGRVFHLSSVGQATMLYTDLQNDGVPFESPSNKEIMATAQYFGAESTSRGFDQETANELNECGITTACYWGGKWVLWGPHTAAYTYEGDQAGTVDARAVFEVNIRMLEHITNSFQIDHGTKIDAPMTLAMKDTILNEEIEKLDILKSKGALIGSPTVEFLESENPTSDMMDGDFVWNFTVTNTPPFKSGTAKVCYTDEGFASYFED